MRLVMHRTCLELNRAFSARDFLDFMVPGALPQASNDSAPLVLNATLNCPNSTLCVERVKRRARRVLSRR